MIRTLVKGTYSNTFKYLRKMNKLDFKKILEKYAKKGVELLQMYTPKDTGKTASSWSYEIVYGKNNATIHWLNNNKTDAGIPIVILLWYGHSTNRGTFVQGQDFINPAIETVFMELAQDLEKEVSGISV